MRRPHNGGGFIVERIMQNLNNSGHHYDDNLHFVPTAPWVTRALRKYVAPEMYRDMNHSICLDPCVGAGHMANAIDEWGVRKITGVDIKDHGWKTSPRNDFVLRSYLDTEFRRGWFDHIFMNPPFKLANEFVTKALGEARLSVAVHIRLQWLEGATRYNELFSVRPPKTIAIFSRRTPATVGQVVKKKNVFMSHIWAVWDIQNPTDATEWVWVPPTAQAELERDEDYTVCPDCGGMGTVTASIYGGIHDHVEYTGGDPEVCLVCAEAQNLMAKVNK